MAAPLAVFLWALPQLLAARDGPTAEALPILFDVRAPHHFRPTFDKLAPFFAWQAGAWLVVAAAYARARLARLDNKSSADASVAAPRPLIALLFGIGGFVIVASLLTTVVQVPQVAQLFPWRMAPFATLVAVVLIAGTIANALLARRLSSSPALERGVLVAAALALAVSSGVALRNFDPTIARGSGSQQRVVKWALTKTPKDALFAVPPDFDELRLLAKRAVVVEWKSAGMLPKDVVAWADRLAKQAGQPKLRSKSAARNGYARMDAARARALHEEFGVDYFVFDKRVRAAPTDLGKPVHEDKRYVVFAAPQ